METKKPAFACLTRHRKPFGLASRTAAKVPTHSWEASVTVTPQTLTLVHHIHINPALSDIAR